MFVQINYPKNIKLKIFNNWERLVILNFSKKMYLTSQKYFQMFYMVNKIKTLKKKYLLLPK